MILLPPTGGSFSAIFSGFFGEFTCKLYVYKLFIKYYNII